MFLMSSMNIIPVQYQVWKVMESKVFQRQFHPEKLFIMGEAWNLKKCLNQASDIFFFEVSTKLY